jgi:hypothetical protein
VVQAGRTFSYGSEIRKGLLTDKKATFIIATGGIYTPPANRRNESRSGPRCAFRPAPSSVQSHAQVF